MQIAFDTRSNTLKPKLPNPFKKELVSIVIRCSLDETPDFDTRRIVVM